MPYIHCSCCRGSQDDECDIERLRNHSSAGSMHSHRSPESNRSSQNNRYIRREHSNGECCAGCYRPGSKHRMSSRQNQIAPEHGQSEKKECCTGCCSNGKQTRTDTPRRRNDDNTNCCVGCCGGTKTSKSPTPRRVERDRSRTTTTTVQSNVMEHNEDRKSGCCACCSTSEMKTQETKRTDSDRTLFTPKHRERTETRSKVQDVQDDNERVDSGCLCGCKKKTQTVSYREHYTEDRYSVSQGENYEANIRSEAPSSLGYSGTSKLNAKRNEEEKAFEEEMERLERENKVKNERQKEIQRQQQMEISLLQEKESRRLKQKQMELEDEQRRLRKEELQKKREEQEREEQRRRMEEKERERRERIAQREERKRELEQSRQRSLVMSEEIADVEEEYMPSNYHIKPKKTRPKAPIRARYLDVFNKNDPSIYGRPRAVHQKVFWRPSKNPIRYPNQSTM